METKIKKSEDGPAEAVEKRAFRNGLEITEFLQEKGWKASKTTIYSHIKEGKLQPDLDGKKAFSQKAVLKYAAAHLSTLETRNKKKQAALQENAIKLKNRKLQEEIKAITFKNQVEQGKYVKTELFDLELATRWGIADRSFKFAFQAGAMDLIEVVDGDQRFAPDLIRHLFEIVDKTLNEFANTKEYHVLFDLAEDHEAAG